MAILELAGNQNDEISQFQLGRYISTNEAFWRIFSFPIHDRYPPVVQLSVHLENGQRVYFHPENAAEVAANPRSTTLTAFFDLCSHDSFAKTLLYSEVPRYYTWNASSRKWMKRKQGVIVDGTNDIRSSDTIGRVFTVLPSNSECFFLRMLLNQVRGPTSFENLRTIDGTIRRTYREACQLLGLLEEDTHWERALQEAASSKMPNQLRALFCVILTNCSPSDPLALWEKFKHDLSEDILSRRMRSDDLIENDVELIIFNEALILIEDICLEMSGKLLIEFGLPAPSRDHRDPSNSEILRETSYNRVQLDNFVSTNIPLLMQDQLVSFRGILELINRNEGALVFLNASGGTGKTFLLNLILAEVRRKGEIIIAVASSGIASTLLSGGRTAHSAFKLPLNLDRFEQPVCSISRNSNKGRLLQRCKAIIWDECTMAHKKSLEALDRTLKDLRRSESIMGGVVVVLAGDFRQTLPVIKRSTPADELNACLKRSHLWSKIQEFKLATNMRVHLLGDSTAEVFSNQLLSIGEGSFPLHPLTSKIKFPQNFCNLVSGIEELIEKVFPNLIMNSRNKDWLCERAILSPRNDSVEILNVRMLEQLSDRNPKTFPSFDTTVEAEQAVNFPQEYLHSLNPSGLPPHLLTLKIGCPIILLRNLKPPKLCNGTRLQVLNMRSNILEATILSGSYKGETVFIPRIPMIPTDLHFEFKRLQFPVRLAYAMTVNKSQGQSLKVAGIDLTEPCFSHGQLYVACSRVGSPSNLFIFAPEGKTKNIVYPQAIS